MMLFRTVKEDGLRPRRSREENWVSVCHTLFCLCTMLYSWWSAPARILLHIDLLCSFCIWVLEIQEFYQLQSKQSHWACGGLTCAKQVLYLCSVLISTISNFTWHMPGGIALLFHTKFLLWCKCEMFSLAPQLVVLFWRGCRICRKFLSGGSLNENGLHKLKCECLVPSW